MRIWIVFLTLLAGICASTVGIDVALAASDSYAEPRNWPVPYAQQADDFDCEDFETQEEAAADAAAEQDADTGNQTPEERRAARRAARQQNEEGQATEEETDAITCADFETAEDAQAAFDEDPEGLAQLDADNNGIACEELLEPEPAAEPEEGADPQEERRRNRRNQGEEPAPQEEEPAPTEVVIDEPETVRIREDFDCVDFEFQEEAQEVYDEDRSDPYNLDPSGDGVACSSLPSSNPRVSQVPRTGIGTSSGLSVELLAAASMLAGLGAIGA